VDGAAARAWLPDGAPLAAALPLLEAQLRHSTEQRRQQSLTLSLRRAEHLSARAALSECRQRCVVVGPDRACSFCHRRVGNSALVISAGGQLMHLGCRARGKQ